MGSNQGIKGLKLSIVRTLRPSELARGYVYISMDKRLCEILDTKDFELEIAGEIYPCRKIDSYGRVQIPIRLLRDIGGREELHIRLVSQKRLKIGPVSCGGPKQGANGTAST